MQSRYLAVAAMALGLSGCGLSYSRLPEVWDEAANPNATVDMGRQIKNAIRCELKWGTAEARRLPRTVRSVNGREVSNAEDGFMPDSWGVLIQLTLQADEKSSFTPGATLKYPTQSFSLGLGGQASSQNVHYHKYNYYYSARDLAQPMIGSTCDPDFDLGPKTSSPFVDASKLGIREWLVAAVQVIDFHRSSRAALDGEGVPLGAPGTQSDSSQYDNKFVVITDASIAATWNLVRVSTPGSPLLDVSRSRTHELLMTLAPGTTSFQTAKDSRGRRVVRTVDAPSPAAIEAHNAALIGSAVANAIRP